MTISARVSDALPEIFWFSMSDSPTEMQNTPTGYEVVASLLDRQEQVLDDLNELNTRIEATIKKISEARQLEVIAEQDSANSEQAPDSKAA